MPDKRDIHKAKSNRNSRKTKQQAAARNQTAAPANTATMTESAEETPMPGKKNKSRR